MESLESCVQQLDMRSMPQFLDQVSDARENEASRHFAISLYAELARVHKQAVIPFIPRMMASIVRSLPFSADSQQLHEACAKVVTSVARYTIDPTSPHNFNQQILCTLCSPLLPVLSSNLESAAAGAAICLQALVESEKWKFAPTDLQELICTKATAALVEQGNYTVTFLHLVKSLAKFSMDASKKHVAEWLGVGLQTLKADARLWKKQLAAAQLITIILKTADLDKLGLDLPSIMKILETGLWDKVAAVQTALAEAFETAKGVALEKHLLQENSTPGKAVSIDLGCKSRERSSDTEESGVQDLFNTVSPRSDASSYEAVPKMVSSTVKFGTGPKRSKQRTKNAPYLSHLNGSLTRRSMLKENTPTTIPRRVLSEIPASGKRLSNSDFLTSSWEAKSLRRSSMDLGSKAATYSMQNQASLGSRKYVQNAHMYDGPKRTALLVNKHVDGSQSISNTEVPLESMAGGNSVTNSKDDAKTAGELNERAEESEQSSPEGASHNNGCLQADVIASESDKDAGCRDGRIPLNDSSMEARNKDSSSTDKGTHLKAHDPSQEFAFRAPCSLLHSLQGKGSTKVIRQSSKESSDCENRAPNRGCWTTSDSYASGDSEEDQILSGNFPSRNGIAVTSCCRSDTCKLRSRTQRHSLQNTNELACRLSSVIANDSEINASGQDWTSSRESSDREVDRNAKVRHRHVDDDLHSYSKECGSQRCSALPEGRPEIPAGIDIKSREVQQTVGRGYGGSIFKGQMCAGAAVGLLCAFGVAILALMVIQHINRSHGLHVLLPT